MLSKVKATFLKHNMSLLGSDITVGVSGGADSVALLLALIDLQEEFEYSLRVVHINHNLRGDESLRDENFVRDLCQHLKISCVVESIDVSALAAERKESIELCARNVRYEMFNKHSVDLIATAHNADDNAETMILNLCRGAGLKGLMGIPPVRGKIIRPLIDCSRAEIIEYLSSKGQSFVVDSSNNSDDYTRNRIRHNVIPLLKEINPSFVTSASKTADILREDNELIRSIIDEKYEQYVSDLIVSPNLRDEHIAIRKRVLLRFYMHFGLEPDSVHISQMDRVIMGEIPNTSLPQNLLFHLTKDGYIAEAKPVGTEFSIENFSLSTDVLPNGEFRSVNLENYKKLNFINNLLFKFSIDCDKIIGNVTVRSRKAGDKYRPVPRKMTKSLKKLLCEDKPTYSQKSNLFVIEDEGGIIFTNLFGADERVKVTNTSENILIYDNDRSSF